MRILLVEDDADLAAFVKEGLQRERFVVDRAGDGQEALGFLAERSYDVLLLDLMMPKVNGFQLLKHLRSARYAGAVIVVSTRMHERDKLEALNGGADDYLVKPFLMSELVARVRAVLRRTLQDGPTKIATGTAILKNGALQMDLSRYEVKKSGKVVKLTKKEFELLECLMRRPGHVLSQSALSQSINSSDFDTTTNSIEVHIKNLRAKIDADSKNGVIQTVRGCGYRLDA
jgi:DNA-binding response OmpR family regulator